MCHKVIRCVNKRQKAGRREKAYSAWYSQAVSHPSTSQDQTCLASEIGHVQGGATGPMTNMYYIAGFPPEHLLSLLVGPLEKPTGGPPCFCKIKKLNVDRNYEIITLLNTVLTNTKNE